jgi:hypothetical protein
MDDEKAGWSPEALESLAMLFMMMRRRPNYSEIARKLYDVEPLTGPTGLEYYYADGTRFRLGEGNDGGRVCDV